MISTQASDVRRKRSKVHYLGMLEEVSMISMRVSDMRREQSKVLYQAVISSRMSRRANMNSNLAFETQKRPWREP